MSDSSRPPSANQLQQFYKKYGDLGDATTSSGNPIKYKDATLTVGEKGPILLEDWDFLDEISHFARERIPERVVHAKGGGASGIFEVTNDLTEFTVAKVFQKKGKKTPIRARFSTVAGNLGSADTQRDPRGFSLKFYTEDGIWDLVGNNTPIFFVRDPIMFPQFIHSQKRNPVTNTRDWDMFWDFFSLRPESMHQVMILFSDRGIPDGFRHMHGYGSHTFTLVNSAQKTTYCKFHIRTNQGIKNLDVDKAAELAGSDPDYAIVDLYNAIAEGNYPSWTLYVQTMSESEAESLPFNPFDVTKVWSQKQYPLREVGKLELNQNPSNYFSEVEQVAFSPANFIPGIGPSPDRMLLGRLFSYHDAHNYRLGPNYNQLAVNCPFRVSNFQRDGPFNTNNQGGAPNYHPNSFGGPNSSKRSRKYYHSAYVAGKVDWYDTRDDDNFSQAGVLYRDVLDADAQTRLVNNISTELAKAAQHIQDKNLQNFSKVDASLARRIQEQLKLKKVKANL